MHPTLKSKPVPVFLLTPNSLLTGRTDRALSTCFKEAEMPSMTADVGTLQSNLCVFTLHHFSFIFTLLFLFAQVMRRNGSTWGLTMTRHAGKWAHTHRCTYCTLCSQRQTFINHEASKRKRGEKKDCCTKRHTCENGWMFTLGAPLSNKYGVSLCWNEVHSKFKIFHYDDPDNLCITTTHVMFSDQGKRGSNNQKILSRQKPKCIISKVYLR